MDARYGKIRGDHETADADARRGARPRSPSTRRQLAAVRAEARRASRPPAELEAERTERLAEANAAIAERRAAAAAEAEAARAAARGSSRGRPSSTSPAALAELATGRRPDDGRRAPIAVDDADERGGAT